MRVPTQRPALLGCAILGLTLLVPCLQAKDTGPKVYVTKTGKKYHSVGCQYLRRSSIPKSLDDALKSGLTACSRCRPPRKPSLSTSAGTASQIVPEDKDRSSATFTCGDKKYCGDMTTCAEAKFYLNECGLSRLDGDKDGVPCEKLCR